MKTVYICSDNITGIFSAIYDAWKTKLISEKLGIALRGMVEQEFFCEYVEVEESVKKAIAVEHLIRRYMGDYTYWNIYHAALSNDKEKADVILGTMLESRCIPDSKKIMEHYTHPKVRKVFELSRRVSNEASFCKEIIRFSELESGILFAEIEPKNQILTCLGDHFENRFPLENWMIYDKTHKMFLVHECGKHWILVLNETLNMEEIKKVTAAQSLYAKLWKGFFEHISIKERESYERQRQHMPLRYRNHMIEFQT